MIKKTTLTSISQNLETTDNHEYYFSFTCSLGFTHRNFKFTRHNCHFTIRNYYCTHRSVTLLAKTTKIRPELFQFRLTYLLLYPFKPLFVTILTKGFVDMLVLVDKQSMAKTIIYFITTIKTIFFHFYNPPAKEIAYMVRNNQESKSQYICHITQENANCES